jgi:hypothetical protein
MTVRYYQRKMGNRLGEVAQWDAFWTRGTIEP